MDSTETKSDIQNFWTDVYQTAYGEFDDQLDRPALLSGLVELEDLFKLREHLAVVEMPITDLSGKRVLEIGPGAGGHSALFASHGAIMTSVDITFDRVAATKKKFVLLEEQAAGATALQSDAENLPFADASFDIVYSNGVLHHTLDTGKAIDEVYRVLKPGGSAIIMLYAKSSFHYWFTLFFCIGLLQGKFRRNREWIGPATEWIGRSEQTAVNPITRCYTASGLRHLFKNFSSIQCRKSDFSAANIPKFGRLVRRWQVRRFGFHLGGRLVYGEPWPINSRFERRLGRYIGWAWNIRALK